MMNRPVILYADDDPDDREMLREYLLQQNSDIEFVEVANGREALLYLRSIKGLKSPPALVILDLNMPVLNGRETLAIMKSEEVTECIPVVAFTTSTSQQDEAYCRKFGVRMITKPLSMADIREASTSILGMIGIMI